MKKMKKSKANRVLMLLENCSFPRDDRVRHEAAALLLAGYQVSVISPSSRGQSRREMVDGVDVYRFPPPPSASGVWGYLWEYVYTMLALFFVSLRVWVTKGFDIVHAAHPPDTFFFIAGFYKLFGKIYVLDHHDLAPELYFARFGGKGSPIIHRILLWLEGLSLHLADCVISTNQSYKQIAIQRGHVAEERISIVRNGPDMRELHCLDVEPAFQAQGKTILGYVGVMGTQDGLGYLMKALYHLVYDLGRTDFLCLMVGDGSAMPMLKSLSKNLNISAYIHFTGWVNKQEEIAGYLNSMDICVAPEPSDPYNDRSTAAKLMEYMALAKPIVAFDLPEHRFTAQDAAVYAKKPHNELDFAKKIAELMDDPMGCKMMGLAGKSRIETTLAWHFQAENLIKAYQLLVSPDANSNSLEKETA